MAKGPRRLWELNRDGQGTVTGRNLGAPVAPADAARLEDLPQPSLAIPTMDGGGGSAGDPSDLTYAKGTHQHPEVPPLPPAVVASTLYTAKIPDPLLRPPCTGYTALGAGYGLNLAQWTQIGGVNTWQCNFTGFLFRYVASGNVNAVNGERLFVDCTATGTHQYDGPYEVLHSGSFSNYAIIRRVVDANTPAGLCHGMVVEVQDSGDGTPRWRTLTTADPIVVDTTTLTFATASSYTSTLAYELLTGPQLTSEGASNETLIESMTSVYGTTDFPNAFTTLAGTPGVTSLPLGMWTANLPEAWVDDDSTGSTFFVWRILKDDGISITELFRFLSQPLGMSAVPMTPQYFQPADIPFSPTYKLIAVPAMYTTSATPVTVFFRYSDPSHATWIQCPFALAMAGLTPSGSIPCPFGDTYVSDESTLAAVKAQCLGDFDTLAVGSIPVELSALVQVDVGQTGTVAVFVGGTSWTADGTAAGTLTVSGTGAYQKVKVTAAITNPGGQQYIKMAVTSSDAAHPVLVQGVVLIVGTGSAGAGGGGGSAAWGGITGTLSAQTDLQSALNAKEPGLGNPSVTGYVLSSTTGGTRSWVAQTGGGGASNWDGGQANTNYGGTIAINGGTA